MKGKIKNGIIPTEADQREFANEVRYGRLSYPRFKASEIDASIGTELGKLWKYILSLESARMDGRRARGGSQVSRGVPEELVEGGSGLGSEGKGSFESPFVRYSKNYKEFDRGTESVVFDAGDGSVVKTRKIHPLPFGHVIDELSKIVYHNYLFPRESYVLEDVIRHEHDGCREFYLLLNQQLVVPGRCWGLSPSQLMRGTKLGLLE